MYIIVAGAGMVGGDLARRLLERKHDVVVIDQDRDACDRLYAETGVVAIHGSVARLEVLNEAQIQKADVVIAATSDDADNLACAILAKSHNVPQIIVRMRDPAYERAYKLAGVTSIVRVLDMMVNEILADIERARVRPVLAIREGRAEIFSMVIPPEARVAGKTVAEIAAQSEFPHDCTFVAVYDVDSDTIAIPRGDQVIGGGNQVYLICRTEDMSRVVDFLTR